jgi:hypothetical protein
MKLFIYKILIATVLFFVLYQVTIGSTIKKVKKNLDYLSSDENKNKIKEKIRKELKTAIKKENYLTTKDAELIKQFLDKISKEIK